MWNKIKEIFVGLIGLIGLAAAGIALFVRGKKSKVSELKKEEEKADNKIATLKGELNEIGKQIDEVRKSSDENWHKHYNGPDAP